MTEVYFNVKRQSKLTPKRTVLSADRHLRAGLWSIMEKLYLKEEFCGWCSLNYRG